MIKPIETVGMVGFGSMGQFMAEKMFRGCEVVAHDPHIQETRVGEVALVDFGEVLSKDVVVLAVPASALETVAETMLCDPEVQFGWGDDTLVVDTCSVKQYPTQVFDRFLPNHNQVLLSHPLFGPESAKDSLVGHKVIVTESCGSRAEELVERWKKCGLEIVRMTADEHDKHMARVQVLPFVLGRLANMLDQDDSPFSTPSSKAVDHLRRLDGLQSDELFQTITGFNPHAKALFERLEELIAGLRQDQAQGDPARLMAATSRILAMTHA